MILARLRSTTDAKTIDWQVMELNVLMISKFPNADDLGITNGNCTFTFGNHHLNYVVR